MADSIDSVPGITFFQGGGDLLDRIAPLWAELRLHHAAIGGAWRGEFLDSQFDRRKAGLLAKGAAIQVQMAVANNGTAVGYCVTTIDANGLGEIDSLFIQESSRRKGIARRMVASAIEWLDSKAAKPIKVAVLVGNDEAVKLYEGFGFLPRTIFLQRPTDA